MELPTASGGGEALMIRQQSLYYVKRLVISAMTNLNAEKAEQRSGTNLTLTQERLQFDLSLPFSKLHIGRLLPNSTFRGLTERVLARKQCFLKSNRLRIFLDLQDG